MITLYSDPYDMMVYISRNPTVTQIHFEFGSADLNFWRTRPDNRWEEICDTFDFLFQEACNRKINKFKATVFLPSGGIGIEREFVAKTVLGEDWVDHIDAAPIQDQDKKSRVFSKKTCHGLSMTDRYLDHRCRAAYGRLFLDVASRAAEHDSENYS